MKSFYERIYSIKDVTKKNFNECYIKEYILGVVRDGYYIVSAYRKPWRWDIEIDKEMRKILKESGNVCDGQFNILDYYSLPELKNTKKLIIMYV